MLYEVTLTFESVIEILKCDYSNESNIKQIFPVVLLTTQLNDVLTFQSVHEI